MRLLNTIDSFARGFIALSLRLFFLVLATGFIALPIGIGISIFISSARVYNGYVTTGFAIVLSIVTVLLIAELLFARNQSLTSTLRKIPIVIIDLGNILEEQIKHSFIPQTLDKHSLGYALAEPGTRIEIKLKSVRDDPDALQYFVHTLLREIIKARDLDKFSVVIDLIDDVNQRRFPLNDFVSVREIEPMEPLILCAANNGTVEIIEILMRKGANPDVVDGYRGCIAALHKARDKDVVELLLKNGADPNIQDQWGQSALWYARDNINIIDTLLGAGADPNVVDNGGRTVMDWYCLSGSEGDRKEYFNMLQSRGFRRGGPTA